MTEQEQSPDAMLERYGEGPNQLEAALAGIDEASLDVAQEAGTWTIRQIVHHIVDGDDVWKACIKAAIGNSGGTFSLQWYWDQPQDRWVESWDYAWRAIEPSLALFRANRRHTVELLRRVPNAWERYMLIEWPDGERRRATVAYVVQMQANHALGHINDIRAIRQTQGI